MEANEVRMLAEQLSRTLEALNGNTQKLEARLSHMEDMVNLRLSTLEQSQADQEARLRAVAEAVARLTTSASTTQTFQVGLAVILSAIAAWLGSQ